jgi:hypothetical protein
LRVGTSGVPSRPGGHGDVERLKRLKIAVRNATAFQRRLAVIGAAGCAQPVTRPHGPPVIGGVPAGMAASERGSSGGRWRLPLNGGAPASASAACSFEISVLQNGLIAMKIQVRALLGVANRLVHEKTAATAAAARPSAACEALRDHRLAWNARGGLADREAR